MLENGVALVIGEEWFHLIDNIDENAMVFLYANDVGIVARGIATTDRYNHPENICENPARCVKLLKFAKLSNPIRHSELPIQLILNRAVVKILDDAATQSIWDIASGRLCWCSI
jgi:hypothetical protein